MQHDAAPSRDTAARPWALVTGAAQRIGRALSLFLARQGYNVIIHYHHSEQAARDLAVEIQATGGQALLSARDLGVAEQLAGWCQDLLRQIGAIDLLINNASAFIHHSVMDLTLADMYRDLNIHAISPLILAQQLHGQQLHDQKQPVRHIINMLDTNIHKTHTDYVSYHLAKCMSAHMTRMLAKALAPATRVNGICPGPILPPPEQDQAYLAEKITHMPLNQHDDAHQWQSAGLEEICATVDYLDRSKQVTGQLIWVDRGQHLI